MKVELQDLSPVKKSMSVEVDVAEVEREAEGVLRGYQKRARISGFRPGKAPMSLIRSRYAKELVDDLRERVVSHYFRQAAEEKGLRPLGDPILDEVQHEAGQPLCFKTTFEVLPPIDLRDYKDVEVRRGSVTVAEDEVDRALEDLRQSRGRWVIEEGRKAAEGDLVLADVQGTPPEGEPFRRERMPIEVGSRSNLAEFNQRLPGAQAGGVLTFPVVYPTDYQSKELAGKTVDFRVEVHEVKRREVAELDDEFARRLGEFDDLAALRARIRRDLEARKQHEVDRDLRHAILDKVLLANPIVLPEGLVDREIRRRLEEFVRNMILQGVDPQKVEVDWEQLRKRQEEPARKAVHARLILDALSAAEGIRVAPAEVEERIRTEARRTGEPPEKLRERLREHGGLQALSSQMVREKTLDYLTSVANIQHSES